MVDEELNGQGNSGEEEEIELSFSGAGSSKPDDADVELGFSEKKNDDTQEIDPPAIIEQFEDETQQIAVPDFLEKPQQVTGIGGDVVISETSEIADLEQSRRITEELETLPSDVSGKREDTLEMELEHEEHEQVPKADGIVDVDFSDVDKDEVERLLQSEQPPFRDTENKTEELAEMDFGDEDKRDEIELDFKGGASDKEPEGEGEIELEFAGSGETQPDAPATEEQQKVQMSSFGEENKPEPAPVPQEELVPPPPAWHDPDAQPEEPGGPKFELRSAAAGEAAGVTEGTVDLSMVPPPPPAAPGYHAPFEKPKPRTAFVIPGHEDGIVKRPGSLIGGLVKLVLLLCLLAIIGGAALWQFDRPSFDKYAELAKAKYNDLIGTSVVTPPATGTGTVPPFVFRTASGTSRPRATGTSTSTSTATKPPATGTGTAPKPPATGTGTVKPPATGINTIKPRATGTGYVVILPSTGTGTAPLEVSRTPFEFSLAGEQFTVPGVAKGQVKQFMSTLRRTVVFNTMPLGGAEK